MAPPRPPRLCAWSLPFPDARVSIPVPPPAVVRPQPPLSGLVVLAAVARPCPSPLHRPRPDLLRVPSTIASPTTTCYVPLESCSCATPAGTFSLFSTALLELMCVGDNTCG